MPEKNKPLNEDLFYKGSSANLPRLHTCKNKVPFWDFSQFAVTIHIHAETQSTIMTNEHTSLEKYTSHTLFEMVAKGLCARGELETEQTATY